MDQISYFNKTVASKDMSGYYLLKNGEYAYNKSYSVGYDFGSVKRLDRYDMGALSTLYICFALKKHDSDFIKAYFDSLKWYREIYMISAEGARNHGLLNVPTDEFFDTKHYMPQDSAEQRKIADFMIALEHRIEAQQSLVDNLKKYKRGVVRTLLSPKRCSIKNVKWTTSRIGDIGTFIKGAPLSKADISLEGTPFILYGELYTTYSEVISNVVRKTQASADKQYYSQIGDVIIPTSGETPEEISTASCVMLPDIILAGDLNIYRCTQVDGRIMSYILNHVVNDRIARIAQGKSVVHVQAAEISKIEITYPDPFSQKTIIAILAAISDRIDQSNAELRLLHELRKALLQKLFI
ncbi:restriction endonuclease subunit S [Gemmiger qucibialis]|uniref:restriction endonuclease subunit S n=1 Tax=Gemmiger qucibialis TaxID=2997294 RepID=UPI0022E53825|nr:restriction endonuclease subunit S [Gemmiger qucibialis]